MLKIYGSPLCPHCVECKASFDANGIEYEFIDITGSMKNLKEFLKIRDTDPVFGEAKSSGRVGIPALVTEDGSIAFDWEKVMKEHKAAAAPAPAAVKTGASCRIDGSGC